MPTLLGAIFLYRLAMTRTTMMNAIAIITIIAGIRSIRSGPVSCARIGIIGCLWKIVFGRGSSPLFFDDQMAAHDLDDAHGLAFLDGLAVQGRRGVGAILRFD